MGTERSVGPSWPPEIPLAGIELLALAAARQQPPPPNSPSPNLGWDEAFAPLPLRAGSLLTQLLCPVVSERGLIRRLGYLFLRRPQMTLSEIASLAARHAHVLRDRLSQRVLSPAPTIGPRTGFAIVAEKVTPVKLTSNSDHRKDFGPCHIAKIGD
jgi:hypothetical protein